jgi:cysteine desulfurase / selenocysteine lyase
MIDEQKIRKDFPILTTSVSGKPLVYLDSTATSLKPQSVIDKINDYYTKYKATAEYEGARQKVATFIGSTNPDEVVFTRNTSESINLVAYSWAQEIVKPEDHVVVSIMEHHSNFVPWQQMSTKHGWHMDIWKNDEQGLLNLSDLDTLITRRTKLLAITAVSNVLGTINPVKEIVARVKKLNPHCLVLVDAAQAVPHMPVDVSSWGADFVAFSSHKMLGPTGVGVLWGKIELLEKMSPFLYGGEMITEVQEKVSHFKKSPHKFEAGTPHIAGVIGLGAAVDYLSATGMSEVRKHEEVIVSYAMSELGRIAGLTIYGPTDVSKRAGVIAFRMKEAHAHDIAQILDEDNVCIRSGNHCAMPLHTSLGVVGSARASFYIYTTREDIDALVLGLEKVKKTFT